MKKNILLFLFLVALLLSSPTQAIKKLPAPESIIWHQTPINITLPVGQERQIHFDDEIALGIDRASLPTSVLRVQNDNHTLYLLAHHAFATTRVEVKMVKTGQIILLDLSAQAKAPDFPLSIVLPSTDSNNTQAYAKASDVNHINYVSLTRFAVQQLYAPARLLKKPAMIARFPMNTQHSAPLFWGRTALAMPLASWRAGDLFVSAVEVKNLLHHSLTLDPRKLCGHWQTATFYPREVLAPIGNQLAEDSTTLFLVSNRAFSQAVQACY